MRKTDPAAEETRCFSSAAEFRCWLEKHHARPHGFWLRFAKKGSGEKSLTYAEAIDEALCFGWIDAQKKPLDAKWWLQKFGPRRPRSGWSKRNTEHAARLIDTGLMRPAGLAQIDAAKADGRWAAAYTAPRDAQAPADFLRELRKDRKALAFFETLNRANIYSIVYRLETAKKPETRARRMQAILTMMKEGRAFHPLKLPRKKS